MRVLVRTIVVCEKFTLNLSCFWFSVAVAVFYAHTHTHTIHRVGSVRCLILNSDADELKQFSALVKLSSAACSERK